MLGPLSEIAEAGADKLSDIALQKPYSDAIEYYLARQDGIPKATAYHEAGHAVACLEWNMPIIALAIGDRNCVHHKARPAARAVICAAGPIAQLAYCQQSGAPYVNGAGGDLARFEASWPAHWETKEEAFDMALMTVEHNWPYIEKLAEFMLTMNPPFSLGPRAIALTSGFVKADI